MAAWDHHGDAIARPMSVSPNEMFTWRQRKARSLEPFGHGRLLDLQRRPAAPIQ